MEKATFGAGCFWGVEETFRELTGVKKTTVGYMGGKIENPTYGDVCSDESGHAEVVQIEFDPKQISYEKLLEVFFANHNPTTKNRQGPDIGSQYRSAIFTHNKKQELTAQKNKERISKETRFAGMEIVTQIAPASTFWRAEEYHQQYLAKKGLKNCQF